MRIVLTMLVLSVLSLSAFGQTSRGTVTGTVTDATGAIVAGAKVEISNAGTGLKRSTVSNQSGLYRFDGVELGTYTLSVTQEGFKVFTAKDLNVDANRTSTIDTRLEVGAVTTVVEVTASNADMLAKESPARGGNISDNLVSSLPVSGLEPISLARTLPGVIQITGGSTFGNGGQNVNFSVNGSRPRANNFMLDGTENNDASVGGNAQSFNMLDAVEEVSVQTSNFSAEFGRGSGGMFNVVTKSGTNNVHGTGFWQYRSQRFDANNPSNPLNNATEAVYHRNIAGFSLGGPIIKNKTHYFGSFQYDVENGTYRDTFVIPTADGAQKLLNLYPNNARLNSYLSILSGIRATADVTTLNFGKDASGNLIKANFGKYVYSAPSTTKNIQWLSRITHSLSDTNQLSFRYVYEQSPETLSAVSFPGYEYLYKGRSQNFQFADTWTLNSTLTNEFRFSYGRIGFDWYISPNALESAFTLPDYGISSAGAPGVSSGIPQFRYNNNWLFQETQTKISGNHTFRYGAEFLKQLTRQRPPFNERGTINYTNNTALGYSAFANYIEDYSGPSGAVSRSFGNPTYYPDQFRQSYYFQDTWKFKPSLTLSLGLRYENFGQPANSTFQYPAFTGFGTLEEMLTPSKVNSDNNNFAPTVGFSWNPSYNSGLLNKIFGEKKSVLRGGYQISYDSGFNNLLSNMAASAPNTIATSTTASNSTKIRGIKGLSTNLANVAGSLSLLTPISSLFDQNLRNPYTQRFSLGIQRELPSNMMLDVSYIGSLSRKLYANVDLNPGTDGNRLYNNYGIRRIRTNGANSNYHSLQILVDRRFKKGFELTGSYTFSKNIDSMSEVFATNNNLSSYTSVPTLYGGLALDRAVSDLHRKHRATISYTWALPGFKNGLLSYPLGGWKLTGITTFQSGMPYTIANGYDRNNDGLDNDRPDIGNPNAPIDTRAYIVPTTGTSGTICATGYYNPDAAKCVTSTDVYWLQGAGLPNGSTVGRNSLYTRGVNNFDMNLMKAFKVSEGKTLEYRLETFNTFNHSQYTSVPERSVVGTTTGNAWMGTRFLNEKYTGGGYRTMRMQLKFIF